MRSRQAGGPCVGPVTAERGTYTSGPGVSRVQSFADPCQMRGAFTLGAAFDFEAVFGSSCHRDGRRSDTHPRSCLASMDPAPQPGGRIVPGLRVGAPRLLPYLATHGRRPT